MGCSLTNTPQKGEELVKIIALIDTGAVYSVIHAKYTKYLNVTPSDICMVAANDTSIKVHGTASFWLNLLGKTSIRVNAYVTEHITEDGIIGMNTLVEQQATICFKKWRLKMLGANGSYDKFQIINFKSEGILSGLNSIKTEYTYNLKPGESIKIKTRKNAQIELKETVGQRIEVQIELVEEGIKISNTSDKPKRIKRNLVVGHYKNGNEDFQYNENHSLRLRPIQSPTKIKPIFDKEGRKIHIKTYEHEPKSQEAVNMVQKYADLFNIQYGLAGTPAGHIYMKDDVPVKRRNYKLGVIEKKEVRRLIKELETARVVKRQKSQYESPFFLKKKPNGEYRLLVDYRQVNEKVIKDTDRVPRLEEVWAALCDKNYFTTLDQNSGFFQSPFDEESKKYTGINVCGVGYVFNSIPQGLSASPGIFQGTMADIFHDLIDEKCIVYLDDIIVYGKTYEEAIHNTEEVMNLLKKFNLKLKTSKCKFFETQVEILGHRISYNQLRTLEKNVKAIRDADRPTTLKKLRSFLGATSFYRRFIQNFAEICAPLTELTKNENVDSKGRICWKDKAQKAFDTIKTKLTSDPVLALYNPKAETYIQVDASSTAYGAVLTQVDPKTRLCHPVAFYSEKVPKERRHLCSFDNTYLM